MITNYLSPLEFEIVINRLPNVEFFVQRASLPGISMSAVIQPTPFNNVIHTPDKMVFNEFNLSFIVDERMENYREVFNWMTGIAFPRSFSEFKKINESDEGLYSDIILLIKNSNKNPNIKAHFINAFPTSLSDITLDTTQSDIIPPEATVTFAYDSFTIQLSN